ncbi:(4Fe-4S)-binding protein [Algoriphagus resistens]|uniref:(4Fe-4S)-binding protein n=1 Tax=Algoriphagus resistens TaxID=1750590 RepID=UPI0007169ACD|nr:(4Fe-4S)-binding protein [Algoriphagus resistens]
METIKEYQKDDLTIVWNAKKCIHAGVCVKMLPKVYEPKTKPWIKPENASKQELKSQIANCPSGALSYSGS